MKSGIVFYLLILCALLTCTISAAFAADDQAIQLYNRADQYINGGDYHNALLLLDQALALNTTEFVSSGARTYALLDKSKAQIELKDFNGALATIDIALAGEETDKLWNNRGYVLFRLGRYDEAVTSYTRAIRITPDYTVALINKGDALLKLAKYEDAIDAYTKAMASDAQANDLSLMQKAKTYKDMGDAYAGLGKYQEAVTAYTASLVNDPGNAETTTALARARQQADAGTQLAIVAIIAILIIGGVAVYILMKKKKATNTDQKKQGK